MTDTVGCADAIRRLWELLDDELAQADREAVEAHLAWCRHCCGELEFARELRGMLHTKADAALPADVATRLEALVDSLGEPNRDGGCP